MENHKILYQLYFLRHTNSLNFIFSSRRLAFSVLPCAPAFLNKHNSGQWVAWRAMG